MIFFIRIKKSNQQSNCSAFNSMWVGNLALFILLVIAAAITVLSIYFLSFIYKFISYPGQKEAAIIPDEQIEKLKFMLNNADSNVEVSDSVYEVGEEVEIVRGPLKGFSGELCYFEKGKPKVGIYLELLGYACVNVNVNDVINKNKKYLIYEQQ